MLCEPFAAALASARDELNPQFARARHEYPALEGTEFAAFLADAADPVVRAVFEARPGAAPDASRAAFELGLALVGQRLAGPSARNPLIASGWKKVLCVVAPLVAQEPLRMMSAVSNAVHNLASASARTDKWIDAMARLAPKASEVGTFLALGQVLAWRCGLAHFRSGALGAAERLPAPLALAAVGAAQDADWPKVRAQLLADPWHIPGRAAPLPAPVARVGGFRGFDGLFAEPPRVAAASGQLFVTSGAECWLLVADAFGATFHRATGEEAAAAKPGAQALARGPSVPPWAGTPTSAAETPNTVAVCASLTHSVLLFARSAA